MSTVSVLSLVIAIAVRMAFDRGRSYRAQKYLSKADVKTKYIDKFNAKPKQLWHILRLLRFSFSKYGAACERSPQRATETLPLNSLNKTHFHLEGT